MIGDACAYAATFCNGAVFVVDKHSAQGRKEGRKQGRKEVPPPLLPLLLLPWLTADALFCVGCASPPPTTTTTTTTTTTQQQPPPPPSPPPGAQRHRVHRRDNFSVPNARSHGPVCRHGPHYTGATFPAARVVVVAEARRAPRPGVGSDSTRPDVGPHVEAHPRHSWLRRSRRCTPGVRLEVVAPPASPPRSRQPVRFGVVV